MKEIYVSTDVESDGPIPGIHSMLSFASAAYFADKILLSTFSANLELLPSATLTRPQWSGGKRNLKHGKGVAKIYKSLRKQSASMFHGLNLYRANLFL
jgi:hypothetical protein